MTPEKIKLAVKWSFRLILLFAISLFLFFMLGYNFTLPRVLILSIGLVSMISLAGAVFLWMFGFLMPVMGQYMYHNIFSEKQKKQVEAFEIYRFLLNLNTNTHSDYGTQNDD